MVKKAGPSNSWDVLREVIVSLIMLLLTSKLMLSEP